jgi:AraC family transcriptional regulator
MKLINKESLRVEVMEIPEMHVAYIRHIGPYKGDVDLFARLFAKLFTWAGARDLLGLPETKVMTVYHDNPDIMDETKLRMSVCITVPSNTEGEGEVGRMTIHGGRYAIAHFEIDQTEYEDAWNALYGTWLPESGFQLDDRPAFEVYLNDPREHSQHKHIVDIYLPIRPL